MTRIGAGALIAFVLSVAVIPHGLAQSRVAVPPALADWQDWVLHGQEFRRCPFLATVSPVGQDAYRCAWPRLLDVAVDARGGRFEQGWQLYAESWVPLPGDLEHWPREVRIDGAAAAIVARDGIPYARLGAGSHAVSGRFEWSTRPERLAIPARSALVALTVDGRRTLQPERPDGALWLGRRRSAAQPEQLEVQAYRLIEDQVPARLSTQLRLQVAGETREILLGPALPAGFVPLGLASELPVRLEPDGRLRVQLRTGSWQITLAARGKDVVGTLARPTPQDSLWPREEIWSFAGEDRLRVATVEGAEGIDPAQAGVPAEWRGYPAFRMGPESRMRIVERSRGLANADENRLTLRRELWLDFDRGGFTAGDEIRGMLRRDWRLEMDEPFVLESARLGMEPLLVTQSASPGRRGVELRTPALALTALARIGDTRGALPVTGWRTRFEDVQGMLHLPPGHRLLGVFGADEAPGSWWAGWGLWNLFGVLIVVVVIAWTAGRAPAAIGLGALLLTYQEGPEYIWLWANLIAAVALAAAVPEGRFRRAAAAWRTASFVVLGIALLPFLWGQLRLALCPQLDTVDAAVPLAVAARRAPTAPPVAQDMAEVMAREELSAEPMRAKAAAPVPATEAAEGEREPQGQRYAPGTLVQTGPGIPSWHFNTYSYGWSGPVEPQQRVRFLYIGPVMLGLWRVTGAVLLAALFLWLARMSFDWRRRLPGGWGAASLVLLLAGAMAPPAAQAQTTPDPALLEQLKARLTAPPLCQPACAEIVEAQIVAHPERLSVTLRASALARVALAVPHALERWQLDEVSVDGRPALVVGREDDGARWVPLEPGAHTLRLAGPVAAAEAVQLIFPQTPRAVTVEARGWDVTGVNDGRLLAASLELIRRRADTAGAQESLEPGAEFPPFVRVTRTISLDLEWSVETRVTRLAPARAAFTVEVPLLPGEAVLTEGLETRERAALVGFETGEEEVRWTSSLPRGETLVLAHPAGTARSEVWRMRAHPQWHLEFEGLPGVLPENPDAGSWVWEFHPRPGEKLTVRIRRPEAAPGGTLAIDSVEQRVILGRRSSTARLELTYRSTQGGRHAIALPRDARVSGVTLDGIPVQLRPENGELSLSLLPGTHAVGIDWTAPQAAGLRSQAAPVDVRAPASNLRTTLELPADRWPLAAVGRGVGPAVLYWGELAVFLVTAWLLGRWSFSPLRSHEWLLLGLGLSTLSWGVLAVVALWLFALRWRERWAGTPVAWHFNAVQLLLALFTVVAVVMLVFSGIRHGLLAAPDMGVVGPGSGGNSFGWFTDRTGGPLPQPMVISVPMWTFRALMFAWALWIAVALARWLRWGWRAWTAGGFWRGRLAVAGGLMQPRAEPPGG